MLNFVEIEKLFPLQEAIYSYNKTQVSTYDPTKFATYSILRPEDDLITKLWPEFQKNGIFR